MKIGFFSDAVYPWHIGGLEAFERTDAEELAKKHEVHFLCMRWPGMKHRFRASGIEYHAFGSTSRDKFYRHGRRSIRVALLYTLSTFRVFFHRFDVIVANQFPFIHIPILKLYGKLFNCPLILDVVEVWSLKYWTDYLGPILGRLAYLYIKYFCGSANAYTVISSATAKAMMNEGVDRNRLNVFAPVLDDRKLNRIRQDTKSKKRQIVFSGRLIKEKRLDRWLDIVKQVHHSVPGTKGLIIGGGPEKDNIEKMIHEKGLGRVVELRPFYEDRDKMHREIASSWVFLQTSEREGLSIITLESVALGVPVVLPRETPIPHEVREFCALADKKHISKLLVEILRSKNPAQYIRNESALSKFSISNVQNFYSGLFKKLGIKAE